MTKIGGARDPQGILIITEEPYHRRGEMTTPKALEAEPSTWEPIRTS
jgi:hypothetical protein